MAVTVTPSSIVAPALRTTPAIPSHTRLKSTMPVSGTKSPPTPMMLGSRTAVALDKVWVASFNGAIGVHDFQGRTIGKESDIPFDGKTGGLMGIAVAPNGDVWIADGSKN
jgi:hypothetical protein